MEDLRKSKIFILLIALYGLGLLREFYKLFPCMLSEDCKIADYSIIFVNFVSIAVLFIIQRIYKHGRFWAISLCFTLLVQIGKLLYSTKFQSHVGIDLLNQFTNDKLYFFSLFLMCSIAFVFYIVFISKEFLIRNKSVE